MNLAAYRKHSTRTKSTRLDRPLIYRLATLFVMLSLVLTGVQSTAAQEPESGTAFWNIYTADDPPLFSNMTNRSLRFDAAGNPRIAYGGDHLYYAWYDSGAAAWRRVVVDHDTQVGQYASLALDAAGNPYISYYDAYNRRLKFAFTLGSPNNPWNIQVVDTPSVMAASPVKIDPETQIFQNFEQQMLLAASGRDPAFQATPDEPQAPTLTIGVGAYNSIAIDQRGYVHISYYDADEQALKYAMWDGSSPWVIRTPDGPPPDDPEYNVGRYSSIAVDTNNRAHITYMDEKYDGLRYTVDPGSGDYWNHTDIERYNSWDKIHFGPYNSLALDSSNRPHVSYMPWVVTEGSVYNTALRYAVRENDGTWTKSDVDSSTLTGWYSSISVNSSGKIMISYFDSNTAGLRYAFSTKKDKWTVNALQDEGYTGLYTSIAVDPNGYPGISYMNGGNGQLQFMRESSAGWSMTVVDTSADVGIVSSLGLHTSTPWISYFNDTGDQLKLAIGQSSIWQRYLLYEGTSFSSMKLNSTGAPRIALYNTFNGDLQFAYLNNGIWYNQVVDSEGDVGQYPSLALDDYGLPHISYYDATNQRLKYAYSNGSTWTIQVVDNTANVGKYSSLALSDGPWQCFYTTSGNCPFIAYFDDTNDDLRFAFKSALSAWIPMTVDSAGDVGRYASMALGPTGNMHISYYDNTNDDLKYAVGNQGATSWDWSTPKTVVDSSGDVGQSTSLAVDQFNKIHVSYYDATNGDLKYALQTGGIWTTEIVDSTGNVGPGSSLALNPSGLPGISYYDATNGDLKFAATFTLPTTVYRVYLPFARR